MKFLFLLLFIPIFSFSQITNKEVDNFVFSRGYDVFYEFESFYNVVIDRDLSIESDDILQYTDDSNEMGKCFPKQDLIIISNNGSKYSGYSIKDVNPKKRNRYNSSDVFIKAVILHEICHSYIECLVDSVENIRREYKNHGTFGSIFIEEGICEYSVYKMGELPSDEFYTPKTMEDLKDTTNIYDIRYEYSVLFVKPILDKYGFKLGIILLLRTEPPTYKEMLNPESYYKKIKML